MVSHECANLDLFALAPYRYMTGIKLLCVEKMCQKTTELKWGLEDRSLPR